MSTRRRFHLDSTRGNLSKPENVTTSEDNDYCLPLKSLAKEKPKSIKFTETDTRASQSTSDAFSGLSALAKACEDVTDDVTLN